MSTASRPAGRAALGGANSELNGAGASSAAATTPRDPFPPTATRLTVLRDDAAAFFSHTGPPMGVDTFAGVELQASPEEMLPRQQRQHVATPATARSGARRQRLGFGRGLGAFAMLARREAIRRSIAAASPPAMRSPVAETPALPTGRACDVETPEARSEPHHESWHRATGKEMDGARAVGTSDEEEGG